MLPTPEPGLTMFTPQLQGCETLFSPLLAFAVSLVFAVLLSLVLLLMADRRWNLGSRLSWLVAESQLCAVALGWNQPFVFGLS